MATVFKKIFKAIGYVFSKMWNRQMFVFLFFLALSTTFWLFQTLNETYEEDFNVPLELRGVPKGIVITSELPRNVKVTLRDKGSTLLSYRYGERRLAVVVDFSTYASGTNGHVRILASELVKQLQGRLSQGTQILALKPDTLEFFYNHGRTKRVPVKMLGEVSAAPGYYIASQRLAPDSVDVLASNKQLDTITAAYVVPFMRKDVSAPAVYKLRLRTLRGAKFRPAVVKLSVDVDRLVEKKFSVPITGVGFPEGEQLRTFPSQVEVVCQVGMKRYRYIKPDGFEVVTDYDSLKEGSSRCRLYIKSIPDGVQNVRLTSDEVEYVIENSIR